MSAKRDNGSSDVEGRYESVQVRTLLAAVWEAHIGYGRFTEVLRTVDAGLPAVARRRRFV